MFRSLLFFYFLLFLFCCQAHSTVASDQISIALRVSAQKKLSQKKQWRKLLHFEEQMFGLATYSQVDSTQFFLAKDGFRNAESELEADIKAMWSAPQAPEEAITQCLFPARYRYIKENLSPEIREFPDRECPRFLKYLGALKGQSASLVFSSFYLDNPSSAFGHTFLRVNKAPAENGNRYELLDYGINYAAEADTGNAFIYAMKGLFGFFPGRYTSVPYYMKVREYNNSEARDLWEYELNIGPAEMDMLISHVWELGQAWIDYWYLTENCSYHMLTLLEAADPKIDITSVVKKWVIPSDTVKDVYSIPGLVKSFHYRPAVRTEFFYRLNKLGQEDQKYLKILLNKREIPVDLQTRSEINQRDLLDAAIDYVDFKFPHETQKPGAETDFKNKLLNARSAISLLTEVLKIPIPEREMPHLGHGSRRWGLGFRGSSIGDDAMTVGLKHALHDRTDLITGYPEYAAITFGDFQFSFSKNHQKLELEDFSLFEVKSYSPLSLFNDNFSWQIKVGVEKIKDENCLDCHGAVLGGGTGYTFSLTEEPLITWFLGWRGAVYYTPYGAGNRFLAGLGPAGELRFRWTERLLSTVDAFYRLDINSEKKNFQQVRLNTQYSWNKNWAFQLSATDLRYEKTIQSQFFYFY